ncbi:MAG: hypothetical protein ACK4UO_19650 [Pseudolabrys sp.]
MKFPAGVASMFAAVSAGAAKQLLDESRGISGATDFVACARRGEEFPRRLARQRLLPADSGAPATLSL